MLRDDFLPLLVRVEVVEQGCIMQSAATEEEAEELDLCPPPLEEDIFMNLPSGGP